MKSDVTTEVRISIDVRGRNRRLCGKGCKWLGLYEPKDCMLFDDDDGEGVWLKRNARGRYLRCAQCLAAEVPE